MPAVIRLPEPAQEPHARGTRPAVEPRLDHATILALQRTAGNRAVARQVNVELRQAPPRAQLSSASEQASPENRQLAAEIDQVDKLDDAGFDTARAANATQVAASEGAAHAEAVKKRDALEYVASQRRRKGPKLDIKQWRHVRSDQVQRRQFLNALVAERAADMGSFRKAIRLDAIPDPAMEGDLAVIRADADQFKREFRGQARINAERMLEGSSAAIVQLLHSYGIPVQSAENAARRILRGDGVAEQAAEVIHSMRVTADQPGGADGARPTKHRYDLAQAAGALKRQQQVVRQAFEASNHADMNVSVASTPADNVARTARQTLRKERHTLNAMWIQAERQHPLLASYRGGEPLEKIDLGGLDSKSVDVEMKTVLEKVLPKVVSIAKAHHMIKNGQVSPLSLAPVVAMTRANMFVPPGSIRAAVVRDLVADAEDEGSTLVMLLSFALAIVTLVPSGGASLAIAAGAASAGFAAYTALKEFQDYENDKTLANTDLDRARALSSEEPSLAGFAMTLIGLGLESVLLVHAFKTAVKLRRMAMAGEESARLQNALDELNRIGAENGSPGLGKGVLDDARAARAGDALDGAATLRPPTATGGQTFRSHGEVRLAVQDALVAKFGKAALPKDYDMLYRALQANKGPVNRQIWEALPHVINGIRDPKRYAEVLADAWALAKGPPRMDINAALEQMARSGGAPVRIIPPKTDLKPKEFFEQYAGQPSSFVDLPLQKDLHGAMTHLIQDLVVDRALRDAGLSVKSSAQFRGLLGKAEGILSDAEYGATKTLTFVKTKDRKIWETELRTGDYIWRMVYDHTDGTQINVPEAIKPLLTKLLGTG